MKLCIQVVSSELASNPHSKDVSSKGVVDVLVAVHGNFPASGLHLSNLVPEVGSVLGEGLQFGISIIRDHAQQRVHAKLIEESLDPGVSLPVHVGSDIVKSDQIPPPGDELFCFLSIVGPGQVVSYPFWALVSHFEFSLDRLQMCVL